MERAAARAVIIPKLTNPTVVGPGELSFKSEIETKLDAYVDYEVKRERPKKKG